MNKKADKQDDFTLARAVGEGKPGALERLFAHIYPLIELEVATYGWLTEFDKQEMVACVGMYLTQVAPRLCRNFQPAQGDLASYFSTVIRNRCRRWYARKRRQPRTCPWNECGVYVSSLNENNMIQQMDSRRMLAAIQTWTAGLDPVDSFIFEHRLVERNKAREVGARLNMTTAAINSRVRRLRRRLWDHLGKAGLLPGGLGE